VTDRLQKILLIDDEEFFRERLARAFADRGFEVMEAAGVDQGLALLETVCPDMAVVDLRMPEKSGMEFIEPALKKCFDLRIVILTGYGSIATAIQAVTMGAVNYLPKPVDADEILAAFAQEAGEMEEEPEVGHVAPSLARAEWEHINRVLTDCGGNISEAARRLGLHRRTLQRKLHSFPPKK